MHGSSHGNGRRRSSHGFSHRSDGASYGAPNRVNRRAELAANGSTDVTLDVRKDTAAHAVLQSLHNLHTYERTRREQLRAALTDFGLAKLRRDAEPKDFFRGDVTQTGLAMGTPS